MLQSEPPRDGSSSTSLLSTAASVATSFAAGASSLFQRAGAAPTVGAATAVGDGDDGGETSDTEEDAVYVGLVRLQVPTSERDRVKNDAILMMAIAEVTETLYLFVDCKDLQPALTYTSELHTVTWDLLASHNKLQLKIEIVSAAMAPHAWDDAFMLPDLGAVYGENGIARQHTKFLSRTGLLPVAYRSPELELRRFSRPGMSYFDDQENRGLRHAIVLVQGAFDHLHNGHRRLLSLAAGVCSERLIVGITAAPQLLALKPFAELIEPLETRKLKVRDFVTSVCPTLSVEFVDVHDPWGPAATFDDSRTLLVISSSDMDLFDAIRARRLAGDFFARIARRSHRATLSSSRIREAIAKASR